MVNSLGREAVIDEHRRRSVVALISAAEGFCSRAGAMGLDALVVLTVASDHADAVDGPVSRAAAPSRAFD
ncbi:MAG: hypothetical protein ACK4IT_08490 [Thioalkalivibrionaceae bacterium]